ncbi:hypothetical protein VB773_15845 [Haloarculaceae archaeon H-GB2-1]|nr:hypothetical protein [Haloarculaceae archaeon H-GB2-1]
MSIGRTLAVGAILLLMTLSLASANVVVASERTVLDPDFVTGTMEREDGYQTIDETLETVFESAVESDGASTDSAAGPALMSAVADRAVTPAYVQQQTEANVYRGYTFLHGERENLTLAVDTEPVVANVSEAVEASVRNRSLADQIASSSATDSDTPLNPERLANLTAGPEQYRTAKAEFRDDLRGRIVDRLARQAFGTASDDERLALVIDDYDPDAYTDAEKDRMVDERESEIRAAFAERIRTTREDELDRRLDAQLDVLRNETTPTPTAEDNVTVATTRLQNVLVTGLTTEMSYETFDAEYTAAKADLATALGSRAESQLRSDVPARISLTENLTQADRQQLQRASTAVQVVDGLSIAFPCSASPSSPFSGG